MSIELATGYVSVVPSAEGFSRKLSDDVDGPLDRSASNAQSKFSGAFKGVAAAAGGLFAAKVGVDLFKGAIGGASDLNETISKSNAIFGAQAAQMEKWASGTAKAIGQSKQQSLAAAADFGNMFSQLGLGSDAAAGMSKQMVELASDFSSFSNVDVSEVIAAQSAAFRGEYDSVQRFLPLLNAASVEQRALELSGKKATKELTAQDKALAVQKLMLEGAGAALGDAARTSDSYANKQKQLAAQVVDLKTKIGQGLLPVMSGITGFLSDRFLPAFAAAGKLLGFVGRLVVAVWKDPDITSDGWVGVVEAVVSKMRELYDFARLLVDALVNGIQGGSFFSDGNKWLDVIHRIGGVIRLVADFAKKNFVPILAAIAGAVVSFVVPSFIAWATAAWAAATAQLAVIAPALAIAAAVAVVAAGLVYAYTHFEGFRKVVDSVVSFIVTNAVPIIERLRDAIVKQLGNAVAWVQKIWPQISEAIGHVMVAAQEIIERVLAVILVVWRNVGDDLFNIVERVFHTVYGVINGVLDAVRGLIQTVLAVINGDWAKAWEGLVKFLRGIWDAVYAVISGALGIVKSIVASLGGVILDGIGNLGGLLVGAGKSLIDGLIEGIKNAGGALIDALFDALGPLEGVARKLFDSNSPSEVFARIGRDIGAGLVLGLESMAKPARQAIEGLGAPGIAGVAAAAGTRAVAAAQPAPIPVEGGFRAELTVHGQDRPHETAREAVTEMRKLAFLVGT